MNRRNFLKTSTALITYAGTSSLYADGFKNDDKYIKDSIDIITTTQKEFLLDAHKLLRLSKINKKLINLRRVVGYGNFNLIGFDEALLYARRYPKIGKFSKDEIALFEEIFYHSASDYGFYGKKVLTELNDNINKKDTIKVPRTGHYLFKGKPVELYEQIRKDIGKENVVLTSGVRGIVKQTQLFLSKIVATKGNVSLASRSLAPPGHSYHGVSDFDIGKVGFGYRNFTEDFAKTDEFNKLMELGFITIRYPIENPYGVRFEPWHIKVV